MVSRTTQEPLARCEDRIREAYVYLICKWSLTCDPVPLPRQMQLWLQAERLYYRERDSVLLPYLDSLPPP